MLTVFSLTVYVLSPTLGLPFEGDQKHESIAVGDLVCKGFTIEQLRRSRWGIVEQLSVRKPVYV